MEALWSVNSDGGWGYLSDGVHLQASWTWGRLRGGGVKANHGMTVLFQNMDTYFGQQYPAATGALLHKIILNDGFVSKSSFFKTCC